MAGEVVAGKRTVIARAGHYDFELPDGHEIDVRRDEDGNVVAAGLRWGDHNSSFTASMEERADAVVIHLDTLVGSGGFGVGGEAGALPTILPYPFPDD